jgi:hypothetical protein
MGPATLQQSGSASSSTSGDRRQAACGSSGSPPGAAACIGAADLVISPLVTTAAAEWVLLTGLMVVGVAGGLGLAGSWALGRVLRAAEVLPVVLAAVAAAAVLLSSTEEGPAQHSTWVHSRVRTHLRRLPMAGHHPLAVAGEGCQAVVVAVHTDPRMDPHGSSTSMTAAAVGSLAGRAGVAAAATPLGTTATAAAAAGAAAVAVALQPMGPPVVVPQVGLLLKGQARQHPSSSPSREGVVAGRAAVVVVAAKVVVGAGQGPPMLAVPLRLSMCPRASNRSSSLLHLEGS